MSNTQESIYNIIPQEYNPPPKGPLYKSKYPPSIPPSCSTFCHKTTSKPKIGNISGQFERDLQAHTEYGQKKTFGHLKDDRKPDPKQFLKSKTGTMGNQQLPPIRNFSYDCAHKKEPVPCVHDKPVQGLKSGKNFIVTNAIQNILSTAKKQQQSTDWLKKKDYGKAPDYLAKVNENINREYEMIQNLHRQYEVNPNCLSEEEIRQLRDGLKRKWNQLNQQYQKKSYIKLFDTYGSKTKKQSLQGEMAQIQQDIKKLNKNYIFLQQ